MNFKDYFYLQERVEQPNLRPIAEEYYNKILAFFDPEDWKEVTTAFHNAQIEDENIEILFPFKLHFEFLGKTYDIIVALSIPEQYKQINGGLDGSLAAETDDLQTKLDQLYHIVIGCDNMWLNDYYKIRRASSSERSGTKKYLEPYILKFRNLFITHKKRAIDVLTHEIQHWIDFSDKKERFLATLNSHKRIQKTNDPTVRRRLYLNSPDELNAWFRHIISSYEPKDFSTFEQYKNTIINDYGVTWDRLKKSNQERIIKRLYQNYDNLTKE